MLIRFFLRYYKILVFGVLQIFFTSPGQTFLVSLFLVYIYQDLGISHSKLAAAYSIATLSAACFLNWMGLIIDRYQPRRVLMAICLAMAGGCIMLANAKSVWVLGLAFFVLRLFGQGVFGLLGSTVLARFFRANRGKAMGMATLGFPLGEAVYPSLALLLIALIGWRGSYVVFAAITLFVMLPVQYLLLNKALDEGETEDEMAVSETVVLEEENSLTLREALKEVRFYLIILASCIPPVVMTALLYHQHAIFVMHGWPILFAATGLTIYAITKAFGSVFIGWVVDKIGPFYPFALMILMIGVGTALAAIGGPLWVLFFYYGLMGMALGFASPVINVVYANLYGTAHFGSIKGFVQIFRNGLTALGPLPLAFALDNGFHINYLLLMIAGIIILLSVVPLVVKRL
jgi:MFS family permease